MQNRGKKKNLQCDARPLKFLHTHRKQRSQKDSSASRKRLIGTVYLAYKVNLCNVGLNTHLNKFLPVAWGYSVTGSSGL